MKYAAGGVYRLFILVIIRLPPNKDHFDLQNSTSYPQAKPYHPQGPPKAFTVIFATLCSVSASQNGTEDSRRGLGLQSEELGTEALFGLGLVIEFTPRLVIKRRKLLIQTPNVKKKKAADNTSSRTSVINGAHGFKWAGGIGWEKKKCRLLAFANLIEIKK